MPHPRVLNEHGPSRRPYLHVARDGCGHRDAVCRAARVACVPCRTKAICQKRPSNHIITSDVGSCVLGSIKRRNGYRYLQAYGALRGRCRCRRCPRQRRSYTTPLTGTWQCQRKADGSRHSVPDRDRAASPCATRAPAARGSRAARTRRRRHLRPSNVPVRKVHSK